MSGASAATAEAGGVPAVEPTPAPRKLTAARMEKALRSDRRFSAAFGLAATITLGAEVVLRGLLQQIVRSDEVGVFRPEAQVASFPIGRVLASAMGRLEREREVEEGLASLVAAGVVVRQDGALSVPLDFEALTRPKPPPRPRPAPISGEALAALSPTERVEYERSLKDPGGRPRRGETREQRSLRLLGVVGGPSAASATAAETSPEVSEVSAKPVSQYLRGLGGEVSAKTSQPRFSGFEVSPYSLPAAESAAESDKIDSRGIQQQQDARAGVETSKPVSGETEVFGGEVSAENLREVSGEVSRENLAGPSGEVGPTGVQPGVAVDLVVLELASVLGISGDRGTRPAELVTEWLSYPGITGARIIAIGRRRREGLEARRLKDQTIAPIGSFDFLDTAIREAAGLPKRATSAASTANVDGPPPLPPELDRPFMDDTDRLLLRAALRLADNGDVAALARSIERLHRSHPRTLAVLLEARPTLAAAVAHARRAAGGA